MRGFKKILRKYWEKIKPFRSVRQPQKLIHRIGLQKPSIDEMFRLEAFAEQTVYNVTGKEASKNREKERIKGYKKEQ